jgi:drug/metabolite transporter (DMT)-like permease
MKFVRYLYVFLFEGFLSSLLLILGVNIINITVWVASSFILASAFIYYISAKEREVRVLKFTLYFFFVSLMIAILLLVTSYSLAPSFAWSLAIASFLAMLISGLAYCAETAPELQGDGYGT